MTLAGLCTKIFLALNQFPCQTRIRSLPGLVSNSLSHCSLIELIDVTLADDVPSQKLLICLKLVLWKALMIAE